MRYHRIFLFLQVNPQAIVFLFFNLYFFSLWRLLLKIALTELKVITVYD
jgi:hypothetical protein